jgi:hypothetical protein
MSAGDLPDVSNVFAGIAQSIHASDHRATLHGVVFDILVGSEHRVGLSGSGLFHAANKRRWCCARCARERALIVELRRAALGLDVAAALLAFEPARL